MAATTPDVGPDTPLPLDDATSPSEAHVEPQSSTRTKVRVDVNGTAQVGRKLVQFGRSLAGALVTVEVE